MKKIRKVGRTQPRGSVDFYKENPALYNNLQHGETIEVPDEVFYILKGVKETEEDRIDNIKTSSKSKSKKTSFSKTMTDNYIDANRVDKQEDDIVIKHNEEIKTEDKVED